mmetsp:Transcript_6441/g.14207  ORF Transcript_6441/g.14207 Transcript_6441/m.14207 type:complete len:133 (+) Transcript_6441:82-480(+)
MMRALGEFLPKKRQANHTSAGDLDVDEWFLKEVMRGRIPEGATTKVSRASSKQRVMLGSGRLSNHSSRSSLDSDSVSSSGSTSPWKNGPSSPRSGTSSKSVRISDAQDVWFLHDSGDEYTAHPVDTAKISVV